MEAIRRHARALGADSSVSNVACASLAASTMEDRLLQAAALVAARDGYAALTVAKVLAAAHVSRATFYQYFTDVDECFSASYARQAELLVREVGNGMRDDQPRDLALICALADAAGSWPDAMRLLTIEGLARGAAGLAQRDALISQLNELLGDPERAGAAVDLPGPILVGTALRFVSMRLVEEPAPAGLRRELLEWAGTFTRLGTSFGRTRLMPRVSEDASRIAAGGKPLKPPEGSPRDRILRATAAVIYERGYRASTVADIVLGAGVSRRSFYNEFAGKPQAAVASFEHGFQQTMAVAAPAFFRASDWPQRIWECALAISRYFSRRPTFAHLGFVECYALGHDALESVNASIIAFTLFLEEGYRHQDAKGRHLSRSSSALTAAAIWEAAFTASRLGAGLYIPLMQPLAVFIALTPFIGASAAEALVREKLRATMPGPSLAA